MHRIGYVSLLPLLLWACGGSGSTRPEEKTTLRVAPYELGIIEGQSSAVVLTTQPAGEPLDWWVAAKPTWLTLSSDSGTVRGTTTLTANVYTPPSQAPGTLTGQLVFATPNGTATLPLTATVPRTARITISPATLAIPAGSDTGEVTLTNTGHGGGSWRASSSVSWLTFPVLEGFVDVGQSVVVKVVVHRASLPPGTSSASIGILLGTDVSPVQVPVSVVVQAPT